MDTKPDDAARWLAAELHRLEQALLGHGASCELDRRQGSTPDLKHDEGRYAALRLARRLLERGGGLQRLRDDAARARAFIGSTGPLAADRRWLAYQRGLVEAAEEAVARFGAPGP